jgi:hypothetical protein
MDSTNNDKNDATAPMVIKERKPTHREHMQKVGIDNCAAWHIAPGGYCLNCGWVPRK